MHLDKGRESSKANLWVERDQKAWIMFLIVWMFVWRVPASVLWLQDIQQELLDVAGGELVDVLGWHVSRPDLQLMFHGLDNPSGDPVHTHGWHPHNWALYSSPGGGHIVWTRMNVFKIVFWWFKMPHCIYALNPSCNIVFRFSYQYFLTKLEKCVQFLELVSIRCRAHP